MRAKRYDPSTETDPLPFEIVDRGSVGQMRSIAIRSVAFGLCPGHASSGAARGTGLVRQGPHLVWRYHQKRTFAGIPIDCPSVGQPVCTSPSRPGADVKCTCGGSHPGELTTSPGVE